LFLFFFINIFIKKKEKQSQFANFIYTTAAHLDLTEAALPYEYDQIAFKIVGKIGQDKRKKIYYRKVKAAPGMCST